MKTEPDPLVLLRLATYLANWRHEGMPGTDFMARLRQMVAPIARRHGHSFNEIFIRIHALADRME